MVSYGLLRVYKGHTYLKTCEDCHFLAEPAPFILGTPKPLGFAQCLVFWKSSSPDWDSVEYSTDLFGWPVCESVWSTHPVGRARNTAWIGPSDSIVLTASLWPILSWNLWYFGARDDSSMAIWCQKVESFSWQWVSTCNEENESGRFRYHYLSHAKQRNWSATQIFVAVSELWSILSSSARESFFAKSSMWVLSRRTLWG